MYSTTLTRCRTVDDLARRALVVLQGDRNFVVASTIDRAAITVAGITAGAAAVAPAAKTARANIFVFNLNFFIF